MQKKKKEENMQKEMMFQLIVLMIELGFCIQTSVAETEYFPGKLVS